jgi:hypothetical protein
MRMERLFENWRSFLSEEDGKENNGNSMVLYHVSCCPEIDVFDPTVAVVKSQQYTRAEYRAWSRPRVFFFTELGQKDVGVGKIPGKYVYRVYVDKSDLYPVYEDPDCYYCRDRYSERVEEYKKLRKQKGTPEYYPVNTFEMVYTLLKRDKPNMKGFIYPQNYKEGSHIIVAFWEKIPAERLEDTFYKEGV